MFSKLITFFTCIPFAVAFSQSAPNESSLTWEKITPPFGEELDGEFLRGSVDGKVRRCRISYTMGEYGGSSHTVFYDEDGNLERVMYEDLVLEFSSSDPDKTVKRILERDLLFQNGTLSAAMEKTYAGETDEELDLANRRAPLNRIKVHEQNIGRLIKPAKEMRTASAPRLVVVTEDLDRAQSRIQDALISDNLDDWAPVTVPVGRHAEPLDSEPEIVALNLLLKFGFVEEGGEVQVVYHDILKSNPKVSASVAVTIDNPGDDEIAAIRYLVEIGNNLETWQLMGIGRQIKRWEDRGGKGWEKR